jgi:hypothetical protein
MRGGGSIQVESSSLFQSHGGTARVEESSLLFQSGTQTSSPRADEHFLAFLAHSPNSADSL